ncbi:MAG: hypothetical protein WCP79_06825 [Bacillota bacterium]
MKPNTLTTCLEIAYRNWSVFQPDKKEVFKDWWKRFSTTDDELFESAFERLLDSCDKFPTFAAMSFAITEKRRGLQKLESQPNGIFSLEYGKTCAEAYKGLSGKVFAKEITADEACYEGNKKLQKLCQERGLLSEYKYDQERQSKDHPREYRGCYVYGNY